MEESKMKISERINLWSKKRKKLDFYDNYLVICKIGIITEIKVKEYVGTWERIENRSLLIYPEYRILIKRFGMYYEPTSILTSIYYKTGYTAYEEEDKDKPLVFEGEKVATKISKIPIQFDRRIHLTDEEKKTKKISLARLEELEAELNS